ncbi:MAG: cobalamin biosynthesis protein CobN [Streptococcus parasanguinis]|nr:cobalamin biosynthesis protein CobN [Streptococcus parasanguinis]
MYQRSFNREISSILVNLKISPDEIKKNNYQITRSPFSLVNKELLKEEYPPEFEGRYSIKDSQFTKVRITYNKEFLPTKIEWYYKGEEGLKWYTWRTYSYPFNNKTEFDKKLDEEIETIKEIQEENEGD